MVGLIPRVQYVHARLLCKTDRCAVIRHKWQLTISAPSNGIKARWEQQTYQALPVQKYPLQPCPPPRLFSSRCSDSLPSLLCSPLSGHKVTVDMALTPRRLRLRRARRPRHQVQLTLRLLDKSWYVLQCIVLSCYSPITCVQVHVGQTGLTYSPSNIQASEGTLVTFVFDS